MGQSGSRVQVGDVVVFETRTLIETRDGRRFPELWGVPGHVVRVFAHASRLPYEGGWSWCRGTAAEVAIGDLRIFTSCINVVPARSRRGFRLRIERERRGQKTKPRKLVGRAGLRTSVEGPTLSERDA